MYEFLDASSTCEYCRYQKAVRWLENMKLEDDEEEQEMNKLLARAYTNLALCSNLEGKPRQACVACNNNPIPSAKSYFQYVLFCMMNTTFFEKLLNTTLVNALFCKKNTGH